MGTSKPGTIKLPNNFKREGHIPGQPESLSLNQIEKIMQQLKNSICKIKKENCTGTGFICILKTKDNSYRVPALITCHHIINNEDIKEEKNIELIFIGKKIIIKVDKSRNIYTSNEDNYDITIIGLENNEFKYSDLLEIDENIFEDGNLNELFENKSVYILHYPKGKEPEHSVDTIKGISIDKNQINHYCATDNGSSGAPIMNLKNFKVIGMHIGKNEDNNINLGILLKSPINNFISSLDSEEQEEKPKIIINKNLKYINFIRSVEHAMDKYYKKKREELENNEKLLLLGIERVNSNNILGDKLIISPEGLTSFFSLSNNGIINNEVYFIELELEKVIKLYINTYIFKFQGLKQITALPKDELKENQKANFKIYFDFDKHNYFLEKINNIIIYKIEELLIINDNKTIKIGNTILNLYKENLDKNDENILYIKIKNEKDNIELNEPKVIKDINLTYKIGCSSECFLCIEDKILPEEHSIIYYSKQYKSWVIKEIKKEDKRNEIWCYLSENEKLEIQDEMKFSNEIFIFDCTIKY